MYRSGGACSGRRRVCVGGETPGSTDGEWARLEVGSEVEVAKQVEAASGMKLREIGDRGRAESQRVGKELFIYVSGARTT